MKRMPSDAKCATCGAGLHLHYCYDCGRFYCQACESDDVCTACKQRGTEEDKAGVKRLHRAYYA